MIELTANSAGIEFIRNEADWDSGDPYGSLRGLQFDIAEAWYASQGEILAGFRPAGGGVDVDDTRTYRLSQAMSDEIIVTRDDVEYWWKVLDRMESLIIRAGRVY